jgi:D-3-phosphoglycerate dehydrogenase
VVRSKVHIDAPLLQYAPNLQFIARAGAGTDNIDAYATAQRNIHIINAPEANRNAVAEHVLAMLLMLLNNLHIAHPQVQQGVWQRQQNRGEQLQNKTVALIGYGNNGTATAQKMWAMGCKVLAYDKYKTNYTDQYATQATMAQIYAQADIVSLHIPLTIDTQNLVNQSFIQNFSKPFYFINAARGPITDLVAIADALHDGKILGACLDVLPNEKPNTFTPQERSVFDCLSQSNKVIFSPHIAGWTHQSHLQISVVLAQKITDFLNTKKTA